MRTENDARLKVLEDRINQLERNLDQMSEARIREAEERAREAARRAEEARKRTVAAAAPAGGICQCLKPDSRKVRVDASKKVEDAAPSPAKPEKRSAPWRLLLPPPAEPRLPAVGDQFGSAMDLYNNQRLCRGLQGL